MSCHTFDEEIVSFAVKKMQGNPLQFTAKEIEKAREKTDLTDLEWSVTQCESPWLMLKERALATNELLAQQRKWEAKLLFSDYVHGHYTWHLIKLENEPFIVLKKHMMPWDDMILPADIEPSLRRCSKLPLFHNNVFCTAITLNERWGKL